MSLSTWLSHVVLLLALVITSLGLSLYALSQTQQFFTIVSASMSPTIPTGSLVGITRIKPPYAVGQIIAFHSSQGTITHRIITRAALDDQFKYQTKGDGNPTADPNWITSSDIIGVVTWHLPYLGYIVTWLRTPLGFSVLILLPTTLLILQELQVMKQSWQELRMPQQLLSISLLILIGGYACSIQSAHGLLTSNQVTLSPNTLTVAAEISPSPLPSGSPGPCDLNVSINTQNTNTGPGSTNINQGTIAHSCTQTSHNNTVITNTVDISVH